MTKYRVYSLVCLTAAMLVAPATASPQERDDRTWRMREAPIDILVLDDLKRSHRESTWSGGLAFYF
jgi:hypothetical protein